ncbi:phosphate transporter PHO1 [Alnus glutinosa]|uniref:phosphate transporter PHO1 n=1 Tax=Alnus glutinosa TaxID=3517 RepID=UPI002D775F4E|nr:phosphate transporter PHO1 [Alnus glutinosa]
MTKFSKELEAQIIAEWGEKFVNYRYLKKLIKRIKLSRLPKQRPQRVDGELGLSIFDPIHHFTKKIYDKYFHDPDNKTTDISQVRSKSMEEGEDLEVYETELSQLFSEENEVKMFFDKLGDEHNKVNLFYEKTENELLEKGKNLNKQLQILIYLKQIRNDRRRRTSPSSTNSLNSPRSCLSPAWSSNSSEGSIELVESPMSETDEAIAALQRNGVSFVNSETKTKTKEGKPKTAMKIDTPATTAAVLLEDLVNNPRKELGPVESNINRNKVQCAEKAIRTAFVELYKGLGLLRKYSSLNMEAFTKIMKKFDKVSNQQASANYLKDVKESPFISSCKVVKLMDDVESIFTKHFANNDRKRAMKFLRPQQPKTSHMLTFFVGLFTGCFVCLFIIYAFLAHLSGIFSSSESHIYMNIVYPVFSIIALLSLHLFMYGCNLFMWKSTRINYNFIFEFSPNTSLKYKDAFLICTTFMTIVVGAMVVHLLLRPLQDSTFPSSQVDTIPGILVLFFIALLICPLDFFYRPTRFCFLRIIRNIFFSPFYKVALVDFFMADQLTSQIPLLRHMESAACCFLALSFRTHDYKACSVGKTGRVFSELAYVISFMPYYWRAMQCARRWFDEYDVDHLANMGKYVSAMVAAGARLTYQNPKNEHSHLWFAIVLVTSVVATVYQLYWDFVKDWGLLNRNSRNKWLRDDLILKKKSIYYISIAFNTVLRVAWVETIFRLHDDQKNLLDFFGASLEVIRRGHWNFYRLENEHLNNVGNYRAVKEVPLPFRDIDSDG